MGRTMMSERYKTVLLPVKPEWAELVYDLEAQWIFQRSEPPCGVDRLILYERAPISRATGEARVPMVLIAPIEDLWLWCGGFANLNRSEFDEYFKDSKVGVAIGVNQPVRYDYPKGVGEYGLKGTPRGYKIIGETTPQ